MKFKQSYKINTQTRTLLADYAHNAWSGWMRHMFSKSHKNSDGSITIPPELVARWTRQMATAFYDLPKGEQESDYTEADRIIKIIDETK